MKSRIVQLCVAAGLLAALATPALSADRSVDIVNNSKKAIKAFYASRAKLDNWQENIVKGDPIGPGETQPVDIDDGSGGCRFDFKAVFSDGEERVSNNVDVCSVSKWTYR